MNNNTKSAGNLDWRNKHFNTHIAAVKTAAVLGQAGNAAARESAAAAMRAAITSAMRESA